MKQSKLVKIIIILTVIVFVGVVTYQVFIKPEPEPNEVIEGLIEESKERALSFEDVDIAYLDRFNGNYEKSELTPNDLDVNQIFSEQEIKEHAIKILSVIDDESREDALYTLPMNIEEARYRFGNSDNMYFGLYTDRVIADIQYVGKSFGESHDHYTALVLAEVKKYDEEDNVLIRQEVLELTYNGLTLVGW